MKAIFVGWQWDVKAAHTKIEKEGSCYILADSWVSIIRNITPALVLLFLLAEFL